MMDLLKDVDLLEDFLARELVFHVFFLENFNGDSFAGQDVDHLNDLTECSLSNETLLLIELKSCLRHLTMFLNV